MTKDEFIKLINENYLNTKGSLNSSKIKKFEEILNYFYIFTDKIPDNKDYPLYYLWWCIRNNFNQIPKCKTCKKEISLKIEFGNKNFPNGYVKKYCSLKCFNNDPEIKEKASKREREKAQERLEKRKKTIIEKYGSWENRPGANNFKTANKKLKNNIEYRKKRLEKTKNTNLQKYGVEICAQSEQVKEKREQTCLNKYGVKHWFQLPEVKEKVKKKYKKYLENGGIEYLRFKYYKNLSKKFPYINYQNLDKLFNKEFIKENFFDKQNHFLVKKFMNFFGFKYDSTPYKIIKKLGIKYDKYGSTSQYEIEIFEFIKTLYQGQIMQNTRDTINPLELDIYIPEKNLAIEFDGLYWHSEGLKTYKDNIKKYHLEKTKACESKNINLIHIFENEWLDPIKQDIWKSIISYKLGIVNQKYYARKLQIKEVPREQARNFLNENHLQGACNAKVNLGLYNKDELISLMTFSKPRYNKNYEYELIRFVSKKYSSCIGCAQKLFKNFIKLYNPKSIISYANRRFAYIHKNIYKTLEFNFLMETDPNYYYFKENNIMKLYHRSQFQKYKLKNYEDTKDLWDENKTEFQIMSEAGYRRIYDCGNLSFEWNQN